MAKLRHVRSTARCRKLHSYGHQNNEERQPITKTHLLDQSPGSGLLLVHHQLAVDLPAHDGHPGKSCQEEELVEVSQEPAADCVVLSSAQTKHVWPLDGSKYKECQQEREGEVEHDLAVVVHEWGEE